ncbi:hypothetical protein DPMN_095594 [Dreissena polymorpha]|uniref:Uncharacterized protein n=1 Tax=Dreissena polymorpha TaxID=45954 RepID=A0A9D4L7P7_DREPO|nr:hypothetical protein DPMN_095594 [Dreissena polymorpha]
MDLDRHIAVSAEDTYQFIDSKKNTSTVKKDKRDINRFRTWLSVEGESWELEDISSEVLYMFMARIFLSARKVKDN